MKNKMLARSVAALALLGISTSVRAEAFYGLSQNTLFNFDTSTPGTISGLTPISGLGGDTLMGIDLRPATGQLYGLGASLRIYTIDATTGVATAVSATPFGTSTGMSYGFDFNPAVDAIRVVNDSAQNFRVSPTTGALLGNDTTLAYAVGDPNFGQNPSIVAVAYGANLFGNTGNSLGGIDSSTDSIVLIPTPNAGTLKTIGLLGVNTTDQAAFDVGATGAFASLTAPNALTSSLYSIDSTSGAATLIGQIGFASPLDGITAVPEPTTWALLSVGAMALIGRARKSRRA